MIFFLKLLEYNVHRLVASDEIDEGEEVVMAQHLLVAADDRYHHLMERLKMICERILCIHIEMSTAAN